MSLSGTGESISSTAAVTKSKSRALTIILLGFSVVAAVYLWLCYSAWNTVMDNCQGDIYLAVTFYHAGAKPDTVGEYLSSALTRSKNIDTVADTLYNACTALDDGDQEKNEAEAIIDSVLTHQPNNAEFHALYGMIFKKSLDSSPGELAALIEFERAKALGLKTMELYYSIASSMWFLETEPLDEEDKAKNKLVNPLLRRLDDEFKINEDNLAATLDAELDEALKRYPYSPQLLQLRATQAAVEAINDKDKQRWQSCLADCQSLANLRHPQMAPTEIYDPTQYECPRLNLESYALYALGNKKGSRQKAKEAFDGVMALAEKENSLSERNFAYATLADYYMFIDEFEKAADCLKNIQVGDHSAEEGSFRETISKESLQELLTSCKNRTHWLPTFPNP